MKAHSVEQTAAWAKSWNMKGYEHLYPENREKQRQQAIKQYNDRDREKFNKALTNRDR
jgi:hypothetical protein